MDYILGVGNYYDYNRLFSACNCNRNPITFVTEVNNVIGCIGNYNRNCN